MRLRFSAALLLSGSSLAPQVLAQSFNIDFGVSFGGPSATYGAAANQPGVWNSIPETGGFAMTLVDITGTATGVMTLATRSSGALPGEFAGDSPAAGDDEALIDDFLSTNAADVMLTGLVNGSYDVWFYCLATDAPNLDWFTGIFPDGGYPDTIGGNWPGSHQFSVTYSEQCLRVTNGELALRIGGYLDFASLNGMQVVQRAAPCPNEFPESCHGDGGGAFGCSPCPCSNDSSPGTEGGCLNSVGSVARLFGSGVPSSGADSLRFTGTGLPPSTFALLASGDDVGPLDPMSFCAGLRSGFTAVTLDGLRCIVGRYLRHGVRAAAADGSLGVTTPGWGAPDGPTGGLLLQGGFVAGQTRHFQLFYRDVIHGICNDEVNTSQAVSVEFLP